MKKIDVASEDVETQFEAVVENDIAWYDGDRTAADYADAQPANETEYDG